MNIKAVFLFCLLLLSICAITSADQQFTLVTPEWVAAHANDANVRILDVRSDPHEYFAGHIPNAVHFADNTIRGTKDGVPVQYLPNDMIANLLSRSGVRNDDTVVIYSDGANVLGATMVAYALERIGHPKIMVMDGGWSVYKASQQVSQKYPQYKPSTIRVHENRSIYVTLDELTNLIGKPVILIIDARPAKAYSGDITTWQRNGHIPGAINIDWHMLTDPVNIHKFKTKDEISKIYKDKGVTGRENIILYCGTSREASLEYAVLKHMMGFPNVRLYEGSWTEYSAHSELPVTTGMNP